MYVAETLNQTYIIIIVKLAYVSEHDRQVVGKFDVWLTDDEATVKESIGSKNPSN